MGDLYDGNETGNDVEWGTPRHITWRILDSFLRNGAWYSSNRRIVLDPFSSHKANELVGADLYYTAEEDGFTAPWLPKELKPRQIGVWINHPYGRKENQMLADKLDEEVGNIGPFAGICFTTAIGSAWFNRILSHCSYIAFPPKRVAFINLMTGEEESSPKKPSLLYFGNTIFSQENIVPMIVQTNGWKLFGAV